MCLLALGSAARTVAQEPDPTPKADTIALTGVDSLVAFAKTLIGVPYRYGGCTPEGFDCSGFVNYVFSNMGISLPRSSPELARIGTEVEIEDACKGDIIIFAGSDPKKRPVGHAGIVVSDPGEPLKFIHSATSGKIGVIENLLDGYDYFTRRFVKLVRVVVD